MNDRDGVETTRASDPTVHGSTPRAARHRLQVPVRYRLGGEEWREGRTVNISRTGLLFHADGPQPPVGASVDLLVTLFVFGVPPPGVIVKCRGCVTRAAPATASEKALVAVITSDPQARQE